MVCTKDAFTLWWGAFAISYDGYSCLDALLAVPTAIISLEVEEVIELKASNLIISLYYSKVWHKEPYYARTSL